MADSVDLSLLATTATDYARDNKDHIFSKIYSGGLAGRPGTPIKPITDYMMPVVGNDEVVLTELYIDSVLQPGAKDSFNPKNNAVKLKPRKAKVKPCKVDLLMKETTIMAMYKSYFGQIRGGKIDRTTYPFEAEVIKKVFDRLMTDLRNIALINGVRNEAGTAAVDTMDGLFFKLATEKASGGITAGQIATINAITAANGVTEIEKIIDMVPSDYFYEDLVCITPLKYKQAYERHYREQYGTSPYNAGFDKMQIEGTMIEFVVEPGMAITGATKFESPVITTRENLAWLYDDEGDQTRLEFDYDKRTRSLAYMVDFQVGMDWAISELIWMGDVADPEE
ncbi:hypothetical protein [Arundinibacter roseus]|uniref:Uncharacterized protein n=1 Tax=Arundinibacter roseus TaxID=2070510 RepID=A0A4R4KJL6_9BACT|nr:hypothetical protein [Arundinibacter roseus]TDB67106.1 hypothetical protein EZE20_08305 [Arundinibacter roseus]